MLLQPSSLYMALLRTGVSLVLEESQQRPGAHILSYRFITLKDKQCRKKEC